MKRTIIAAAVLALGVAGAGDSLADPGNGNGNGPGPNGHNNYGLCNAYSHNGNNDHGKSFQQLVATAGDYNGDGQTNADDVTAWCGDNAPKPGNGGGNGG